MTTPVLPGSDAQPGPPCIGAIVELTNVSVKGNGSSLRSDTPEPGAATPGSRRFPQAQVCGGVGP